MRSAAPLAPAVVPAAPWRTAPQRPGMVPRSRVVRRLLGCGAAPIVTLVAPAGYGKSTVLAEWAARDERPFRWLTPADAGGEALRLVAETAARRSPKVLAIDDAHLIPPAALEELVRAASSLPLGSVLALAARRRLAAPTGRLRAHRLLVEIGMRDLAMARLEAALLFDAAAARLDAAQVDRLVERTEGWPAALYLAALTISEQPDAGVAVAGFTGADRVVAEYIECELLADLPADRRAFLRRTSLLGDMTGPLCDAVLETSGSAALLEDLRRSGLPIEAVDRRNERFRYHTLLREMLQSELARHEGDLAAALHARAADWHERHGEPARAGRHAVACRDAARAGRLLATLAPRYAADGRAALLAPWLEPFGDGERAAHPELAVAAATYHLAEGRLEHARRAIAAVDADREPAATAAALVRACIGTGGPAQIRADAAAGASACESLASLLRGVADHLAGERTAARAHLEHAVGHIPAVAAASHAQLALLAVEASDWDDADQQAGDAHAAIAAGGTPDAVRALVLAVVAVVAAHRGDLAQSRHDAADARRLLGVVTGAPAWLLAEASVWLARAEIRLSDGPAARALLARAARIQAHVPGAPVLAQWVHDGWERADAFAESATGDGPMLTTAELRVLRLLTSHLSFREIGVRLHVSTNTVKTQALSVYRKLDVSSRSEAVARGSAAGLVGA